VALSSPVGFLDLRRVAYEGSAGTFVPQKQKYQKELEKKHMALTTISITF
jgi:hypothetical protein